MFTTSGASMSHASRPLILALVAMMLTLVAIGCASESADDAGASDTLDASDAPDVQGAADAAPADGETREDVVPFVGPAHDPWTVIPSAELGAPRGWTLQRGIIHTHSPYSHDACDDHPFIDGVRDEECFEDVRDGMCQTAQDFVFLTDHDDLFAYHEYPDVLLYATGDELIERDGLPVANRLACPEGHHVIVSAGTESAMMPIGLEHHVGDTLEERMAAYNEISPEAVERLKDAGAVALVHHTEEWDLDTLISLPLDGIEIYNVHFNLMDNMGAAIKMYGLMRSDPDALPAIELALLAVFQENTRDLFRWSKLVELRPTAGILATDSHRNVFQAESPDGERLDSFRRLMHWFSNYVLVRGEGGVDDRLLKDAIRHGRVYGAFDVLGYPQGFDFHATQGEAVHELGDRLASAEGVHLVLTLPRVARQDPAGPQAEISGRILKSADGEWLEVASGDGATVEVDAEVGVYRAEVHITPHHLTAWLGATPEDFLHDWVWVYSNAIYVGMHAE
jgi:hypothetical protein